MDFFPSNEEFTKKARLAYEPESLGEDNPENYHSTQLDEVENCAVVYRVLPFEHPSFRTNNWIHDIPSFSPVFVQDIPKPVESAFIIDFIQQNLLDSISALTPVHFNLVLRERYIELLNKMDYFPGVQFDFQRILWKLMEGFSLRGVCDNSSFSVGGQHDRHLNVIRRGMNRVFNYWGSNTRAGDHLYFVLRFVPDPESYQFSSTSIVAAPSRRSPRSVFPNGAQPFSRAAAKFLSRGGNGPEEAILLQGRKALYDSAYSKSDNYPPHVAILLEAAAANVSDEIVRYAKELAPFMLNKNHFMVRVWDEVMHDNQLMIPQLIAVSSTSHVLPNDILYQTEYKDRIVEHTFPCIPFYVGSCVRNINDAAYPIFSSARSLERSVVETPLHCIPPVSDDNLLDCIIAI